MWQIEYLQEAVHDLDKLDHSQRVIALKAIGRVAVNPLPSSEGGLGKPLGNTHETKLAGLLKIKLKASGLRIVYALVREQSKMLIVVVCVREDNAVYKLAQKRIVTNHKS